MKIFLQRFAFFAMVCLSAVIASAQAGELYIRHYGGNYLTKSADSAVLGAEQDAMIFQISKVNILSSYYNISLNIDGETVYLTMYDGRDMGFGSNKNDKAAQFKFVDGPSGYTLIQCRPNDMYLGVDVQIPGGYVYGDRDDNHWNELWYLTDRLGEAPETEVGTCIINPQARRQTFEGWGVSLCWWANVCGGWEENKVNELVDWLVSPNGLNYNIFRYNIGGGDDPEHRNCKEHHMASGSLGKGLRAEMEGFKDSSDGDYIWTRDAAQRNIMLKIKEKRPDAIFEAFSNSAPYYMTSSGCVSGHKLSIFDNVKEKDYEEFAHYLVDVCRHYRDAYGIEFRTLEPFNEPSSASWIAGGVQEGCHWTASSQPKFVKVLYPILQQSGLSTVIAASDENNISAALSTYQQFEKQDALDLVGQWNVHTYTADNVGLSQYNTLIHGQGKRVWMSETGGGATGIRGNLMMARRMFDDMRYLEPEAWCDWQYVEEGNDQWCMVQANFSDQSYRKVKNFYVRQQVSRYIPAGYSILATSNEDFLAAVSPDGKKMTIVILNDRIVKKTYKCRLLMCDMPARISGTYTDLTHDGFRTSLSVTDNAFTLEANPLSIYTYQFSITPQPEAEEEIADGNIYMIVPQYAREMALTAGDDALTIEPISYNDSWTPTTLGDPEAPIDPSQCWLFEKCYDNSYFLISLNDKSLLASSGYDINLVPGESFDISLFDFVKVDDNSYRITLADETRVLDLNGEKTAAGTRVGAYEYGNDPKAGHRHWQLMRVPLSEKISGIDAPQLAGVTIKGLQQMIRVEAPAVANGTVEVYSLAGVSLAAATLRGTLDLPIAPGCYIVRVTSADKAYTRTVMVK